MTPISSFRPKRLHSVDVSLSTITFLLSTPGGINLAEKNNFWGVLRAVKYFWKYHIWGCLFLVFVSVDESWTKRVAAASLAVVSNSSMSWAHSTLPQWSVWNSSSSLASFTWKFCFSIPSPSFSLHRFIHSDDPLNAGQSEDQRLGGIHPEHEPVQGFQAGAERNWRDPAFWGGKAPVGHKVLLEFSNVGRTHCGRRYAGNRVQVDIKSDLNVIIYDFSVIIIDHFSATLTELMSSKPHESWVMIPPLTKPKKNWIPFVSLQF